MLIVERNNLKDIYSTLVKELLFKKEIINGTKEINNACFILHNPTTKNINFGLRNISQKYCEGELKWYWSGDNSCKEIGKYGKMWLSLTDDGITNNSAYGYILHKKYDYDQVKQIIELLSKDKNTRRAILNISDPTLNKIETHDLQCTIAIQFLIRNNELQETVYMRSSDIYFGIPYDVIYFISIGEYIAKELGINFGLYTHHSTSLHMYERDFDKFNIEESKTYNIDVDKIIKENYEK